MPVAVDHPVVREQVRLLYYANGGNLSDAARAAGIPIDRAEKWKERGLWDAATDQSKAMSETVGKVRKVVDSVADQMSELGKSTKLGFAGAARKVADHLNSEKVAVNDLMEPKVAVSADKWAGIASKVHGWDAKEKESGGLVAIQLIRCELPETVEKRVRAIEIEPVADQE